MNLSIDLKTIKNPETFSINIIKSKDEVIQTIKIWMDGGARPVEIITDNGKEFGSKAFRKMCWDYGVENRSVSLEAHRSNGRVERAIRTIREGLIKSKGDLNTKLTKLVQDDNNTYHSAIRCTPAEAWNDSTGIAQIENSKQGKYAKRFVVRDREKFVPGQEVRIAQRENLGDRGKNETGRFNNIGKVLVVCGEDSYLVRENDRLIKKCHYDLKGK